MGEHEEKIRAQALAVGFDAARITAPDPPGHAGGMAAWLKAEMHGKMGYLKNRAALRAGSLNSPHLLDGTQSVVLVALSYDFDSPPPPALSVPRGTVARYARGQDYHPLMWEKLDALAAFVQSEWPGTQTRRFADSGPIRERELAARAGLGWQGKHTGLISLDLGNWFFLGALLTTLPLTPDDALPTGHCGTCTRCLSACPTGALVAPLTLDARRCISYLTIELKGSIPLELRPLMGDRIFGCDDCLAACPWNDHAQKGRETRLAARDNKAAHPNLLSLLELLADETRFKDRFVQTPLLRTGREGLRRNVCVALGNIAGREAISALACVRDTESSPVVREHAQWAIGQIERRASEAEGDVSLES